MDLQLSQDINSELRQVLSPQQAKHYRIIPKSRHDRSIVFYSDERENQIHLQDELQVFLDLEIKLLPVKTELIDSLLSKVYEVDEYEHDASVHQDVTSKNYILHVIREAQRIRSSDIHIEPLADRCKIRFRVDGELREKFTVLKSEYPALINRIKILANLDISEKRLPQDGRILTTEGRKQDIRVSIIPTLYGEKVVLRLLGSDASGIELAQLGLNAREIRDYSEVLKKTKGIILISGPTGSGKTTTLYASLKILNNGVRNILTVEDPIEYTLEGINQVQVKEDIGLGFARVLRSFLRQDPDIIMLGEIRDEETAQMAIRLALTGHLVLSTIHTNSAWGTIARLKDMKIPSYLIGDTMNATLSQRLIKKLCDHCKQEKPFDRTELPRSYRPSLLPEVQHVPIGCNNCHHTGYKGRKAIYEVIQIDEKLVECIRNDDLNVQHILKEKGVFDLKTNAYELFCAGVTSLEEIYPILID